MRKAAAEALESRVLLSASLVKLMNSTGTGYQIANDSTPLTLGGVMYFLGNDVVHGEELWRSDGTPAGTRMVADVNPGPGSSRPWPVAAFNGAVYFNAYDAKNALKLWKTDGTAAGTVLVDDWAQALVVSNNRLWITPRGDRETSLKATDGVTATTLLQLPVDGETGIGGLTPVGDTLYFYVHEKATGTLLYRSDGTAAGPVPFMRVSPAGSSGLLFSLVNLDGLLYYTVLDDSGWKIWRTDGTSAGTAAVYHLPTEYGTIPGLKTAGGSLYFDAYAQGAREARVIKIDGATNTASVLWTGFSSTSDFSPPGLYRLGNDVYFEGIETPHVLYRTNGTPAGTVALATLDDPNNYAAMTGFTAATGKLYFRVYQPATGVTTLYMTDGTAGGTKPVQNGLTMPFADTETVKLLPFDNRLYFIASDGVHGNQLWQTDGTSTALADPGETAAGWVPDHLVGRSAAGLAFGATGSPQGSELWNLPVVSGASASFVKTDTTTQGKWTGTYGADGFSISGGGTSLPGYATIGITGSRYLQWARTGATASLAAPQSGPGASTRVAACDSSDTSFTVDLNLTDSKSHQITFDLLDYDDRGRSETVTVANADTGQVLDTRTISGFRNGTYLVYTLAGHVKVNFANLAGSGNAVLSGILFGGASTPFSGQPISVPSGTIEAENFDTGGEGVGYHDTTPANQNAQYRPGEAVDINQGGSNGYSVGYTAPGEWLAYSITAPTTAMYVLDARVADYQRGGTFHVEIDGQDVTGAMTVPDTGPWDTWQTITSRAFKVSAGDHTMRVVMDSPGYWGNVGDFDSFKFAAPGSFHGTPFNITDTLEAEDFDNGGEGVAYHDTTPQNIPGKYRNTAVDVAAVSNASNGYAVGYTAPGEWLEYTLNAPTQGTYNLQARIANYKQGGTFHVEIDGVNVTGTMTVPDSGPWDTWTTLTSRAFDVSAGSHVMRVVMDEGGYWGNIGDFDSFKFVAPGPFLGHAFKVAGETIEAENFDNGGEGVVYHDTTNQNLGGRYRFTAVDINAGGSNGYNVGYTAPGEWLKYSITSPSAGTFVLQSAVASLQPGGSFHVEVDGQNVTGTMSVPDTGGWYNFQTLVSPKFDLSAGDHTMKVVMDSQGPLGAISNFDYFRFAPAGIVTLVSQERSVTEYPPTTEHPYPGPQVIQTDAGDFLPFEQSTANAFQSSRLDVGTAGAAFSVRGFGSLANLWSGAGGSTDFRVDFDVNTPVPYVISFSQGHTEKSSDVWARLDGPSPLSIFGASYPPRTFEGTLQTGRYALRVSAGAGQGFDLGMNIS